MTVVASHMRQKKESKHDGKGEMDREQTVVAAVTDMKHRLDTHDVVMNEMRTFVQEKLYAIDRKFDRLFNLLTSDSTTTSHFIHADSDDDDNDVVAVGAVARRTSSPPLLSPLSPGNPKPSSTSDDEIFTQREALVSKLRAFQARKMSSLDKDHDGSKDLTAKGGGKAEENST